ncbi:MAG: hypothetical protein Q9213_002971 [Squamulea squamosa]
MNKLHTRQGKPVITHFLHGKMASHPGSSHGTPLNNNQAYFPPLRGNDTEFTDVWNLLDSHFTLLRQQATECEKVTGIDEKHKERWKEEVGALVGAVTKSYDDHFEMVERFVEMGRALLGDGGGEG